MYAEGKGVQRDYVVAVKYLTRACDAGSPSACGNLGLRYVRGEGVAKDARRGVGLLQRSCDDGQAHACSALGLMYVKGESGIARRGLRACRMWHTWHISSWWVGTRGPV
jgi:uncharacterized protein